MRTKLLFTAFALSALFASCAKEELPVVKMETSDRALVENVSFNLTADASTRLTYNGAYVWEAGDQLGACLMDEVIDLNATNWAGKYELVDYIQTNYKFTRDAEGNWETEAKLCEGNYFLSFPYNANRGLRSAYEFSCAEQTLEGTEKADLMKAFAKNNSFVGYAPIEASNKDHESVAVSMSPVFESTGFTLKNTGTNDYTIEKIVLSGAKVSSYAVVDPTNPNYDVEDNKTVLVYTENGRIDVTLEGGNTVKPQDAINVIVMSGTSALVADNDAVLEIHTNKGLIRGINLNEKQTAMNGKLGEGATVNVLTDKALAKLGAADKVTVTFDDTSIDVPNVMDIYSTDELYRLIEWNSSIKDVAVVANLKADVELTAEMYNILKNSGSYGEDKSTLLIQTAEGAEKVVTVNADVEADAMDLVTFNNVDVVVEGTQSIANAINVDVTVKKGATFDVKAAVAATITNKGTVNANIAYKKNQGTSYYTITKLNNEATVNVAGYALYTELANSTKASVVNVAENTTLTVTGKNYGTINNKGAIEGSLENTAYVNKKYNPTINNYGKIFNVVNNNVIVMMTKDARINVATGDGEIDNTVQSDYIAASVDNTVFVKVADLKATELNEIIVNADATKAYISGTLTIDADKEGNAVVDMVKEIETAGNLTITGKGKVFFKACETFTVAANTETVVDNGSTLSLNGGDLIVNGLLTIKNNGKVVCGSRIGKIENYGTMTTTKQVDVNSSQDLSNAIANGETNVYLTSGTYTIPSAAKGKALKIVGTKDVVIDATYSYGQSISGANIAFEGVTIKGQTSGNYKGFTHVEKMTFTDCVFEGKLTNYSNTEFINCTFNNKSDYAVWTSWGGTEAKFVGCTFNSGGKALLVYGGSDGNKIKKVYVQNCVFNSDKSSATNKAAIETGDDYTAEYTIEISNTTVSNNFSVTTQNQDLGGTSLGTKVWGNKDLMPSTRLNVIIDGINVY